MIATGIVYEGIFEDGVLVGQGSVQWQSGDTLTGDFDAGGGCVGVLQYESGEAFEGEVSLGRREGRSVPAPLSLSRLHCRGGRPRGEGPRWREKAPLSHLWRHFTLLALPGRGVMQYKNGVVFDGAWAADVREGPGRLAWPSGDWVQGEWVAGACPAGTVPPRECHPRAPSAAPPVRAPRGTACVSRHRLRIACVCPPVRAPLAYRVRLPSRPIAIGRPCSRDTRVGRPAQAPGPHGNKRSHATGGGVRATAGAPHERGRRRVRGGAGCLVGAALRGCPVNAGISLARVNRLPDLKWLQAFYHHCKLKLCACRRRTWQQRAHGDCA